MSYSYKPVLIKAILCEADARGRVRLDSIVSYFKAFYRNRRDQGLTVEKRNSVFTRTDYTDKEAEQVILTYPYKRFEGIQMLRHTKTLGVIQVEESVWKQLTAKEKDEIGKICDEKLAAYYDRLK